MIWTIEILNMAKLNLHNKAYVLLIESNVSAIK